MLVSIGIVPSGMRLHPTAYEMLALLPRLLTRLHPKASATTLADLKRQLTWNAVNKVLAPINKDEVAKMGLIGYRRVPVWYWKLLMYY